MSGERKAGGAGEQGRCSVVIPVRDMARLLPEAIESALGQEGCDVIVVDDASADGSAGVARGYDVKVVDEGRIGGPGPARNRGARETRAPFLLFLDADDRLLPGAVARLVAALEADDRLAVAYGEVLPVDARGVPGRSGPPLFRRSRPSGDVLLEFLEDTPIITPGAACVRRRAFEEAGGFRDLPYGQDWELWCRLARLGPFRYVGSPPIVEYRSHAASQTAAVRDFVAEMMPTIDAIFDEPALAARVPPPRLARLKRRAVTSAHGNALRFALKNGRWADARRHGFACLRRDPTRFRAAVFLVAALLRWLPAPLRRRIK